MSLDGGLERYISEFNEFYDPSATKRYNDEPSPKGKKVVYLNMNGWDGDREEANKILKEGETYTIEEIYVHRSSSEVVLQEHPEYEFNTVMFGEVEEDE